MRLNQAAGLVDEKAVSESRSPRAAGFANDALIEEQRCSTPTPGHITIVGELPEAVVGQVLAAAHA